VTAAPGIAYTHDVRAPDTPHAVIEITHDESGARTPHAVIEITHDESGARTPHAVIEITANQVVPTRVAVAALTPSEARAFAAEIISLADAGRWCTEASACRARGSLARPLPHGRRAARAGRAVSEDKKSNDPEIPGSFQTEWDRLTRKS